METSDSECFESADEDLDSDHEENDHTRGKHPHSLNPKVIEPELCKLKLEENKDSEFSEISTKPATESSPNFNSNKTDSEQILILNADDESSHNLLKEAKTSKQHTKEELTSIEYNNGKEVVLKPEHIDHSCKNIKDIKKDNQCKKDVLDSVENNVNVPESEENLWDDDELDWEIEGSKEEAQRTEKPPNLQNEDSGWDDFDAEWESDLSNSVKPNKSNLNDFKETLDNPGREHEQDDHAQSSWGGWSNWGVSSILNTATQSVSTITNHVSQGLSSVLEGSIGIPDPEEMARINAIKNNNTEAQVTENLFGLENLVSGVSHLTKFVESTGTKVITGSLDTLEAIGKKTVEVLQEGDPGLKKKRALFKLESGKPNLSQILREAKEKSEEESKYHKDNDIKRTKNYESLFDDYQGLVHLEALEMLSKVCTIKLHNSKTALSSTELKDMQETLEQVKELCELPEEDDEDKITIVEARDAIENAIKEINIPISYSKLFGICEEANSWLGNVNFTLINDVELHQQAIETLAQLTAAAVEQFHKTGELLMVKEHRSTADEADSLVHITVTLKSLILVEASKFTDKLRSFQEISKCQANEYITNIFYEAANSGTYIQTAFQLLIPVLQVGAI
ncbi:protein FAM114A2 [Sitophilus oryzae]|uniref:Protein FAM114A2 n=1 Tax=Sitophilus oryzae TaxID=7048 RepID=A0A6J2Y4T8_SITOR|nr:protein FAM114A2 [Sitophilus oryzae]